MFLHIVFQIFLSTLFWFCFGLTTSNNPLQDFTDNDNNTLVSYICDDGLIRNINHQLEKQSLVNEILSTKLSLLQTDLRKQLNDMQVSIVTPFQNCDNYTTPKITTEDTTIKNQIPANCAEAVRDTGRSGIHQIQLKAGYKSEIQQPFFVYCEKAEIGDGNAWTIIQRRQSESIEFYRNWTDYKYGFGNLDGNFFIGLEKLHALTHSSLHELWVKLEDFENAKRSAKYDTFAIGSEKQAYALNILGKYSGDAGDALRSHEGYKFSTLDMDNDNYPGNCAAMFYGGWWYHKCHSSNLNGLYLNGVYPKDKYAQGVDWSTWRGQYYSLKYVHMAIRSVKKTALL